MELVSVPLFEHIARVDIARLVPELDDVSIAAGEMLFQQGDPGDALYIVQSGALRAELDGPDGPVLLEIIHPGHLVGEVAVLGNEPRTATIRALEPSTVWRLPREKLDDLLIRHPSFAVYLSRLVGRRLANVNQHLREAQDMLAVLGQMVWSSLSVEARSLLIETAPLSSITPDLARELMGDDGTAILHELESSGAIEPRTDGRYRITRTTQVVSAGAAALSDTPGDQARVRRLAERCHQLADYPAAVEAYLASDDFPAAAAILARHSEAVLAGSDAATYISWATRAAASDRLAPAVWYRCGVAASQLGDTSVARSYFRQALHEAQQLGDTEAAERARTALSASEEHHAKRMAPTSTVTPVDRARSWPLALRAGRLVGMAGLVVLACAATWWAATTVGLALAVVKLLTIFAGGIIVWLLDIVPEFVTALIICALAVLWDVAPADIAFSGLAGSGVLLLFVIFAFVSLVSSSGLAFRVALLGLRFFPPSYRAQMWALGLFGLLATPVIPGSAGRLTLVSPLVMAIKDTLRLPDLSRASAGLAMAASMGFGQMSFLVLNGSGTTLLIASLLPLSGTQPVTWLGWLLAALPMAAVYFVGSMLLVQWYFGPSQSNRVELKTLRRQLATLGKIGAQEALGLAALTLLLLIFIFQPWHGLDPAWLALLALGALAAIGAGRSMFQQIDYGYLLYFGAFQSMAIMIRSTGTDAAFMKLMDPYLSSLPSSPYLFLSAFAVVAYLVALLPGFPAQPVLMIAALPLAGSLGYHPLVFGLVILLTSTPILIPRLSALHWLFWNATEQRTFTHRQAFEFAVYRAVFMLLAVIVSVAFWQRLGFIPMPIACSWCRLPVV